MSTDQLITTLKSIRAQKAELEASEQEALKQLLDIIVPYKVGEETTVKGIWVENGEPSIVQEIEVISGFIIISVPNGLCWFAKEDPSLSEAQKIIDQIYKK